PAGSLPHNLASRTPEAGVRLQPALVAEEPEHPDHRDRRDHDHGDEAAGRVEARKVYVLPEEPGDHGQREHHHAEDGEHVEDVVLLVRDERLVRVLERLDDLLVVVEEVPDPLARVDDVVEVELQLLGQESLHAALELPDRGALRPHDLAVRDDLLLHLVDVADALLRARRDVVDRLVDLAELEADLVEDGEAVVVEVVEDLVEQAPGAAREEVVAKLVVVGDALEQARDGAELDHRQRDDVVRSDEHVELARVQPADARVVDGKVEDGEQVAAAFGLRVLVDLRPLATREHVLDVERMPAEALSERRDLVVGRPLEVDPGEA